MLQESFSRAAINDEHIINTYYTFLGCNYIFLQFCLILGWRKSIISILSETSSNKTPPPLLNVPGTFLWTKSINESSLSHACPRALKIYPFPWRSGNKSILFFPDPTQIFRKFPPFSLMQDYSPLTLKQLHEKAVLFDCSG